MYAITDSGYRAVTDEMALAPDETLVAEVPASVLSRIWAQQVRVERNQKLRATDWTQGEDCQLTPELKAALALYRQKLRDLPAQPGFPDCGWPVPPPLPAGAASVSSPGVSTN
ncbi:tail fiber assembly protein [Stenotrophomonas maltophilia]|uniref:tail fiber assembly protein n=1 Tax=Stenotrophomonas maltophilia TaxID=40324 RepID=UPI00131213E7|nr:tail fiber assembly protein [Stenotrophomonas maltophilia]MDH7618937.1 tail fiber assembly protein [Stenotrophomonas maltophilia]